MAVDYKSFYRNISSIFLEILVCAASLRGLLPLFLGVSAYRTYYVTSAIMFGLCFLGLLISTLDTTENNQWHILFALFGLAYFAIEIIFGRFEVSVLYIFLAPFSVYVFRRINNKHLSLLIDTITVVVALSVIVMFMIGLQPDGYDRLMNIMTVLRPDTVALSRTGVIIRSPGITGSYHDSANILGMVAVFFSIHFLLNWQLKSLLLAILSLVAMLLTQSAANIFICLITIAFLFAYILLKRGKGIAFFLFLFFNCIVIGFFSLFGNYVLVFTRRLSAGGDWSGMMNGLSFDSFIASARYVLLGHAALFHAPIIASEIALLKIFFELGIFGFALFSSIYLWPFKILLQRSWPKMAGAYPPIGATVFGMLSLLHYGSVMRITSIFLFFMFYAMIFTPRAQSDNRI